MATKIYKNMSNQKVLSVSLTPSAQIPPDRRPTISLSVVARGSNLRGLREAIDPIAPHVNEVVVVLVDVEDHAQSLDLLGDTPDRVIRVNPTEHPHLFLHDNSITFQRGRTLAGEEYSRPFSGQPFVCDWAAVRDLGLSACTQKWSIHITDDERLASPWSLIPVCAMLEDLRRDSCYIPARGLGSDFVARLCRKSSTISFEGPAQESLEGLLTPAVLTDVLQVTRDPPKRPHVFQVLYAASRRCDWALPPIDLLHLARAAQDEPMPDEVRANFIARATSIFLDTSQYAEERAWACAIRGEVEESRADLPSASLWYERSLDEYPGWKSALRLCHSRFLQGEWQSCLDAWSRYLDLKEVVLFADDSPIHPDAAFVCVATSLHELGRESEARRACEILQELHPTSPRVLALCGEICR